MARPISKVAPGWWDYTTLDTELLKDAENLTPEELLGLSRDGFQVAFYDTLEEFLLAEALEYIHTWRQATPDQPVGICDPIGIRLTALMISKGIADSCPHVFTRGSPECPV